MALRYTLKNRDKEQDERTINLTDYLCRAGGRAPERHKDVPRTEAGE